MSAGLIADILAFSKLVVLVCWFGIVFNALKNKQYGFGFGSLLFPPLVFWYARNNWVDNKNYVYGLLVGLLPLVSLLLLGIFVA
jgi:hypothetical protein